MITKETCVKIWNAWNEIEKSEQLIKDMAERLSEDEAKNPPTLYNAFGDKKGLQLGVPSGKDSHQIFGVSIELGVQVIEAHIEKNKKRLEELKAIAKIELKGK
jgi:hypothetical protein